MKYPFVVFSLFIVLALVNVLCVCVVLVLLYASRMRIESGTVTFSDVRFSYYFQGLIKSINVPIYKFLVCV